jgi:hypothetical protein
MNFGYLKLNYNTSNEGKHLQSNYRYYMNFKLEWKKEGDIHGTCVRTCGLRCVCVCVCVCGRYSVRAPTYRTDSERYSTKKITNVHLYISRFQWPRGLRRRSAVSRLQELRVQILPMAWMFASCECCTGLSAGLITRLEKSYRVWCV